MSSTTWLFLTSSALLATAPVAYSQIPETPPGVPGVIVVPAPSTPLDYNAASASELAQSSIPPRPDAVSAPAAYQKWQRAVASQPLRDSSPAMIRTNRVHGPAKHAGNAKPVSGTANSYAISFSNWSGTSVVDGATSNIEAIIGEFTVPQAHQPFGACGNYYSSEWPGIDGNGSAGASPDVLQAGTNADSLCKNGNVSSSYSAWIEWYPNYETLVSSPAISPGDLVFIEVWSVSTTVGYAYIFNESTNIAAGYQLTAPAGTTLRGNSVEWIVERPGIGGSLSNLQNYISSAWSYGVAWNYTSGSPTYYTMGADPSVGLLELITMVDNNGAGISKPTIEGGDFLWFTNYGSSQ